MDEQLLAKNVNILLHAISNVVSKSEDILSDICIVAINAWQTLVQLLS